jgi:hypothetical protein
MKKKFFSYFFYDGSITLCIEKKNLCNEKLKKKFPKFLNIFQQLVLSQMARYRMNYLLNMLKIIEFCGIPDAVTTKIAKRRL